jgi:hypothetical protein
MSGLRVLAMFEKVLFFDYGYGMIIVLALIDGID